MTKTISAKKLCFCAIFTCIIAVCSWISIPAGHISFTLQTFAIALMCYTLSFGYSMMALSAYILLGIVGVPVFANFNFGAGVLIGPTGGYIIGFFPMCMIISLGKKIFKDNFFAKLTVAVVALAVLYLFGTVWFVTVYSKTTQMSFYYALTVCVFPFVAFDVAKIVLAIIVGKRLEILVK